MPTARCSKCERYEGQGHNYCRMCGVEFKPNHVKKVEFAVVYSTNEKFCGYCGKTIEACKGHH